eukprot:ANDGO_03794.mRNA.1 Binding partner of ACD11 1
MADLESNPRAAEISSISPEEQVRCVYVTGISASANEKEVSDFFAFCGTVSRLIQDKDPNQEGFQFAFVVFEDEQAANTAQLLSNAVIAQHPITVAPFLAPHQRPSSTAETTAPAGAEASSSAAQQSGSSRSATAVMASLAAAGLIKGQDVMTTFRGRAQEFDSRVGMSEKAKFAATVAESKVKEVDEKFKISQTLNAAQIVAQQKMQQIDATYGLSEKGKIANEKMRHAVDQVMQAPPVKAGIDLLALLGGAIVDKVKTFGEEVQRQASTSHSQNAATPTPPAPERNVYEDLE